MLTYRTLDDSDGMQVFLNGEEVTDFAFKECSDSSFAEENTTRISIGEQAPEGTLPEAAFDDVIIWYRSLSREEMKMIYSYYKGNFVTQ